MVPFRYEQFVEDLIALAESGVVPLSRIDDAVQRILRVKFVSGLFEHPFSDRSLLQIVGCKVNLGGVFKLDKYFSCHEIWRCVRPSHQGQVLGTLV